MTTHKFERSSFPRFMVIAAVAVAIVLGAREVVRRNYFRHSAIGQANETQERNTGMAHPFKSATNIGPNSIVIGANAASDGVDTVTFRNPAVLITKSGYREPCKHGLGIGRDGVIIVYRVDSLEHPDGSRSWNEDGTWSITAPPGRYEVDLSCYGDHGDKSWKFEVTLP